jgi:hypothetical protein
MIISVPKLFEEYTDFQKVLKVRNSIYYDERKENKIGIVKLERYQKLEYVRLQKLVLSLKKD